MTGAEVKKVVALYAINESILETARAVGMSTVKVRKILITEGLWESATSKKIGALLKQGRTTEEIAKILCMSVKNVQAYMPYERGVYRGEDLSLEAVRADKYRARMKTAASMQVVKRMGDKPERETVVSGAEMVGIRGDKAIGLDVLRLHLELDMEYVNEDEKRILTKYGSMKASISRELLVPADITLHALHYAILRAFGWQNGHLHNFTLPEDVFGKLTEKRFDIWAGMAGVYFRFPTEDYEDIYWDDDYREGESFKSWLRKKYTGPYKYKGYGEHYLMNQMEVQGMISRWEEIMVHEFAFRSEKQPEPYKVKLKEATIDQVEHAFADVFCYELLERLPLADLLYVQNCEMVDVKKVREYLESRLKYVDVEDGIEEYQRRNFSSRKQEREFLEKYNMQVLPITDELIYRYDYGDGWKVKIRCDDVYRQEEEGIWNAAKGNVPNELYEDLNEVVTKYRPVCIAKDGIELVDDVGGIRGFCDMLQMICEADVRREEEWNEREQMLDWAHEMGWTGRWVSPKRTL